MNHSCNVTTVSYFEKYTMAIVAKSIVKIPKGGQITHSYIDCASTKENRRSMLQSLYFFFCRCQLCETEETVDKYFEAFVEDYKDADSPAPTHGESRDVSDSKVLLLNRYEKQSRNCHFLNLSLLSTRTHLISHLLQDKDYKLALIICKEILEVYKRIYPSLHPLIALRLYAIADIYFAIENSTSSLNYYKQALDIFNVIYGDGSEIVGNIQHIMKELL
jgi:tetratricopeptide (TPR) repeat protein